MKSRNHDHQDIVEAHLGLFRSAPEEQMSQAEERALHRLRTEARQAAVSMRRGHHVNWRFAFAGAVAAVLFTGIAIWRPAEAPLFRVVEGVVHQGETLRTNGGSGAVLALTDGSRIEMRSKSELSLERADDGMRIRLHTGGIIVNAAKSRSSARSSW
jgi:ferric-dicitrate binding protein FerR (iron transport regulator)